MSPKIGMVKETQPRLLLINHSTQGGFIERGDGDACG